MNKELAIDMLAAVKKPARYTGGEFGSISLWRSPMCMKWE